MTFLLISLSLQYKLESEQKPKLVSQIANRPKYRYSRDSDTWFAISYRKSARDLNQWCPNSMPPKASTSVAKSSQPVKLNPQDVPAVFQRYRTELQNIAQKIGELESEMEEHALVILSTLIRCRIFSLCMITCSERCSLLVHIAEYHIIVWSYQR